MYKVDLALNNLQWLICHKTKSKPKKFTKIISSWNYLLKNKSQKTSLTKAD